jgi:hypothetical protein
MKSAVIHPAKEFDHHSWLQATTDLSLTEVLRKPEPNVMGIY